MARISKPSKNRGQGVSGYIMWIIQNHTTTCSKRLCRLERGADFVQLLVRQKTLHMVSHEIPGMNLATEKADIPQNPLTRGLFSLISVMIISQHFSDLVH